MLHAPVFPQIIKFPKSHAFRAGRLINNKNNGKYNTSQEEKYKGKNKQATFAAMTSKSVFYAH